MKNRKKLSRLPVDVSEALRAIATTGKGRCWFCDQRLPEAEAAIAGGWDVRRIDEMPVASIILVCPGCVQREAAPRVRASAAVRVRAAVPPQNGARGVLAFHAKRA